MKGELVAQIIAKFVELRAKTYGYLMDNGSEDKKSKNRKIVIKNLNLKIVKNVQNQLNLKIK